MTARAIPGTRVRFTLSDDVRSGLDDACVTASYTPSEVVDIMLGALLGVGALSFAAIETGPVKGRAMVFQHGGRALVVVYRPRYDGKGWEASDILPFDDFVRSHTVRDGAFAPLPRF